MAPIGSRFGIARATVFFEGAEDSSRGGKSFMSASGQAGNIGVFAIFAGHLAVE